MLVRMEQKGITSTALRQQFESSMLAAITGSEDKILGPDDNAHISRCGRQQYKRGITDSELLSQFCNYRCEVNGIRHSFDVDVYSQTVLSTLLLFQWPTNMTVTFKGGDRRRKSSSPSPSPAPLPAPLPGLFRATATLISCVVNSRSSVAVDDPFSGPAVPTSFYKYIENLFPENETSSPVQTLSKALCYMDAVLCANSTFRVTDDNVYRFTAAAVILSTRGYIESDQTCDHLASLVGVSPAGLLSIEKAMMELLNCELWVDPKKLSAYKELLLVFNDLYGSLVLNPIIHEEYRTVDGGELRGLRQVCRDNLVMPTDVFHLCSLLPDYDHNGRVYSLMRKKLSISQQQFDSLDNNMISVITEFTIKLRASLPTQWMGVLHQWQQEESITNRTILQDADAISNRCIELGYSPSFFSELVPGKVLTLVEQNKERYSVAISLKRSIQVDVTSITKGYSTIRDAAAFLVQKLSPTRFSDELVSDIFSTNGTSTVEDALADLFNTTTEGSVPENTTKHIIVTASSTRLLDVTDNSQQPPLRGVQVLG
eukprot:TRINITY_DN21945_c0_g1_i1.p1 TRINITY_DN21945_c0_g1~~TRINITY_DN21945_c0_g1_i1.p1  ORF type:complete len:560 (+),score=99.03 TRINITY_DN21945_c0_g1_i1:57-1682(+)